VLLRFCVDASVLFVLLHVCVAMSMLRRCTRLLTFGGLVCTMVTMVTMGGDLQPGCLADRLLTGLGQPQIYP